MKCALPSDLMSRLCASLARALDADSTEPVLCLVSGLHPVVNWLLMANPFIFVFSIYDHLTNTISSIVQDLCFLVIQFEVQVVDKGSLATRRVLG